MSGRSARPRPAVRGEPPLPLPAGPPRRSTSGLPAAVGSPAARYSSCQSWHPLTSARPPAAAAPRAAGTVPRLSAAAGRGARRSANRTPCSARTAPRRVWLSGAAAGARPPQLGLSARLSTITSPSAGGSKGLQFGTMLRGRVLLALTLLLRRAWRNGPETRQDGTGDDFSSPARGLGCRGGGYSRLLGRLVNTTRPAPPRARQPPRPAALRRS